jgi:hypothetical protein
MHLIATLTLVLAAIPQAPAKGPLETYKAYLEVLAKADSLDQLLPHYTKELAGQLAKMPKEMQGNYLKMNKRVLKDLKVTKETVTATKAEYELTATTADGKPTTGSATLVKEGGAWKIHDEAWATSIGGDQAVRIQRTSSPSDGRLPVLSIPTR